MSEVVSDNTVEATSTALAQRLAVGPAHAYAASKRLLNEPQSNSVSTQLYAEARAVGKQAATHEFVEGVRAFIEKRTADFRGA